MHYLFCKWIFCIYHIATQIEPALTFQEEFPLAFLTHKFDKFSSCQCYSSTISNTILAQFTQPYASLMVVAQLGFSLSHIEISLSSAYAEYIAHFLVFAIRCNATIHFVIGWQRICQIVISCNVSSLAIIIVREESIQIV